MRHALREYLEEGFFPIGGDGGFDYKDENPVVIAIAYEELGFGPHGGWIFVDQNRYHTSEDSALQSAVEAIEQKKYDNDQDEYLDIFQDRAAEALGLKLKTMRRKNLEELRDMLEDANINPDDISQETEEWFMERINGVSFTVTAKEAYEALSEARAGIWLKKTDVHIWNSPEGDIY
jgi:hypothetical protein